MREGANFMLLANVRSKLCSIKPGNKSRVLHLQLPHIIWSMGQSHIVFCFFVFMWSGLSLHRCALISDSCLIWSEEILLHMAQAFVLIITSLCLRVGLQLQRLFLCVCMYLCIRGFPRLRVWASGEGPLGCDVYVHVNHHGKGVSGCVLGWMSGNMWFPYDKAL